MFTTEEPKFINLSSLRLCYSFCKMYYTKEITSDIVVIRESSDLAIFTV